MELDEFCRDAQRTGSKFVDWRKDGRIVFWLHPKSQVGKRVRIMYRKAVQGEDGEWKIGVAYRFFKGKDDISARFLAWLEKEDSISPKDVVLRVEAGDEVEEYRKGDLFDMKGFDWQKRILNPRIDYVFCIIDHEDVKQGMQVLTAPKSAGTSLAKIINSNIQEYGEEEGSPFKNPWPVKLSYDEKAQGKDKYHAERHMAKLKSDVEALFEETAEDVLAICDPAQDEDEDESSRDLLRAMCVVQCPLFGDQELEEPEGEPPPAPAPAPRREAASKPTTAKVKKTRKATAKTKPTQRKAEGKAPPVRKKKAAPKLPPEPEVPPEPEEGDPELAEDEAMCPECDRVVPVTAKICPWGDCRCPFEDGGEEGGGEEDGGKEGGGEEGGGEEGGGEEGGGGEPYQNGDASPAQDDIPF